MPRIASITSLTRPSGIKEVYKKYFFALEGIKTEVKYIKELIKCKNINSNVFYFYRNKSKSESSNLLNITNSVLDIIDGKSTADIMYIDLIDIIYNICNNHNLIINKDKVKSKIESFLSKKNLNIHDEVDIKLIADLMSNMKRSALFVNIEDIINNGDLINIIKEHSSFCAERDHIIIIGDRDRHSFVDMQYDDVLEKTKKYNISLIISNPCIEFWFLLHHTDALNIDMSSWINSKDVSKLVTKQLKVYDSSYNKTSFCTNEYISKTEIALKNCRNYCTDLKELKDKIGTNMHKLFLIIDDMK